MKKEEISKIILAAAGGAIGGVIAGILFAPEKGTNTRKKLTKSGNEYLKKLNAEIDQINQEINKKTKSAKKGIQDLGENAREKGKSIYQNTRKLTSYDEWTKDELYDYAKEKEIENYSTMNKAELIEALSNT